MMSPAPCAVPALVGVGSTASRFCGRNWQAANQLELGSGVKEISGH